MEWPLYGVLKLEGWRKGNIPDLHIYGRAGEKDETGDIANILSTCLFTWITEYILIGSDPGTDFHQMQFLLLNPRNSINTK